MCGKKSWTAYGKSKPVEESGPTLKPSRTFHCARFNMQLYSDPSAVPNAVHLIVMTLTQLR